MFTLDTRPEALLFDCDGVLVDTEPDGHRVAFNEAFTQKGQSEAHTLHMHAAVLVYRPCNMTGWSMWGAGLMHEWSLEKYGELLRIGGGKERMTAYFMVMSSTRCCLDLQPSVMWNTTRMMRENKFCGRNRSMRMRSPLRA